MITTIVYGRNDAHWSNIHKRAAISLNCLAYVMNRQDDEIIFVDYNTPNDLPTFPEAIADTLTDNARKKIRVLRVRPEIHDLFSAWTPLKVIESIARNIGIRRMNRSNKWTLLTNTDCVISPVSFSRSIFDIIENAEHDFYCNPRYEIPEALWGSVDRKDPKNILSSFKAWSHQLKLRSLSLGEPQTIFDYPGDFQLVATSRLWEVKGINEHLLLIGKCDVDLAKRLFARGVCCHELTEEIDVFHCSHMRGATKSSDNRKIVNQQSSMLSKYAHLKPNQPEDWGFEGYKIEEIDLKDNSNNVFISSLSKQISDEKCEYYPLELSPSPNRSALCNPVNVLTYIIDMIYLEPKHHNIGYIGLNERMVEFLNSALKIIGFENSLFKIDLNLNSEVYKENTRDCQIIIHDYSIDINNINNVDAEKYLSKVELATNNIVDYENNTKQNFDFQEKRHIFIHIERTPFYSRIQKKFNLVATPLMTRVSYGYVRRKNRNSVDAHTLAQVLGRQSISQIEFETIRERLRMLAQLNDLSFPECQALMGQPVYQLAQLMVEHGQLLPGGKSLAPFLRLVESQSALHRQQADKGMLTDDQPRPALSKLASIRDWDNPDWCAWAQLLRPETDFSSYTFRRDYEWDRIQVLYALDRIGLLEKSSRVLLESDAADPLHSVLASRVTLLFDDAGQPSPLSAVISMRNRAQHGGRAGLKAYLQGLASVLAPNGVVILSLDISVVHNLTPIILTGSDWNEASWIETDAPDYQPIEPILPGMDPTSWNSYLPASQPHQINPIFLREKDQAIIARSIIVLRRK